MKSLCFATLAFGLTALASAQVDSVVIHERVYNDDSESTLVTVNNYPSLVSFNETNLDGDGSGSTNRHDFTFSEDGINDYVHSIDTFFEVKMDVSLSGTAGSVKEAGIRINSSITGDAILLVKNNGEIAAFGGGFPFHLFQAAGSVQPATVTLGIKYFLDNGVRKVTYTAGSDTFTDVISNNENGAVDFTVGGYGQFGVITTDPTNAASAAFSNISYAPVPEPASMFVLSLGAASLLRRRKARRG